MGDSEFCKCEICDQETTLERMYFNYPIHCECCGSKNINETYKEKEYGI